MSLRKTLNDQNLSLRKKRYKRKAVTAITSLAATFMIYTNTTFAEDKVNSEQYSSIDTIFHVYYGEEKVGIVDDIKLINNFENKYLSSVKEDYEEMDISLSEEIVIVPERVFNSRSLNRTTIARLEQLVDIVAETYEIKLGDEVIAHVLRDEEIEDFKTNLLLNFVSEKELEQYEQSVNNNEVNIDNLKAGDSVVTNIELSKPLSWHESKAQPDEILTMDEVLKMIKKGTLEEETYRVKKGDVLSIIAEEHDLSLKEIIQLNPSIDEDTLLQIGDELNVTVAKPLVDVTVEKVSKKEETIPYKTETKEDSSMWKGDTKVKNEGSSGKKVVEYGKTYVNGQLVNTDTIDEEIVIEPVNKVVVKGTKTSPSRGTGSLNWPTVGGYISSPQGYRWGSYHKGIDIARPSNYAILAADNGTVTAAGWMNGYGNAIRINHNNGMVTFYAHLSSIHVSVGQTVGKGQQIGVMGTTGNSTGIHLHFEVYENGALKNPLSYLR